MKTVTATTIKDFEWRGQSYVAGQSITTSLLDAVALAKKHQITLTKRKVKLVEPPPPIVEAVDPPKPKRRAYARRDLQPAETTVMAPDVPEVSPSVTSDEPQG